MGKKPVLAMVGCLGVGMLLSGCADSCQCRNSSPKYQPAPLAKKPAATGQDMAGGGFQSVPKSATSPAGATTTAADPQGKSATSTYGVSSGQPASSDSPRSGSGMSSGDSVPAGKTTAAPVQPTGAVTPSMDSSMAPAGPRTLPMASDDKDGVSTMRKPAANDMLPPPIPTLPPTLGTPSSSAPRSSSSPAGLSRSQPATYSVSGSSGSGDAVPPAQPALPPVPGSGPTEMPAGSGSK